MSAKTYPAKYKGKIRRVTIPGETPADEGIRAAKMDAFPAYRKYVDEAGQVRELLNMIGAEVSRVNRIAKANPQDWGYAGTMGHVRAQLQEILKSFEGIKGGGL